MNTEAKRTYVAIIRRTLQFHPQTLKLKSGHELELSLLGFVEREKKPEEDVETPRIKRDPTKLT